MQRRDSGDQTKTMPNENQPNLQVWVSLPGFTLSVETKYRLFLLLREFN